MPAPLTWTAPRDTLLRRLRADGQSWEGIAAQMRISRWAVVERGRRIGARKLELPPAPPAADLGREPLPAGHPIAWQILTAGTLLADSHYPYPPLPVAPTHGATA